MGPAERAGVNLFHDNDARIIAQFPGELAATDIDRVDLGGAMLQEAIGESAGRGSKIERDVVLYVDSEFFEGVLQLESAAADIPLPG